MVYAVIDTNVLVSAIFAAHPDSATVIVRDKIMDGTIVPLYKTEEVFTDPKDVVFYDGHGKHEAFPSNPHCGHACRIAQDS